MPQKPLAFLKEIGVTHLAYYSDPSAKVFQDLKLAGKAFGMPTTLAGRPRRLRNRRDGGPGRMGQRRRHQAGQRRTASPIGQSCKAFNWALDSARGAVSILNHMVKFSAAPLDRTFAALADPTRRALVARLAEQPDLSVSALAEPFDVSLPAIMKHLDVLSDAGLVARTKSGRTVTCRLNAAPMQDASAVAQSLRTVLVRGAATPRRLFLEEEDVMAVQSAVKPSLTLKRRFKAPPAKVFAAWTDPEKIKRWMGPGEIVTRAPKPTRGPAAAIASRCSRRTASRTMSAASIARSSPTRSWCSPGPGIRAAPDEPYESLVTVLFKPDGDGTLLTLTHEQLSTRKARDGHQQGWIGALDKLEKFVA